LRLRLARLLPAVLFAMASSPHAGEFVINPLRVSLDKSTKASEIIVRNDDKVPLRMQVEAMGWSQGGEGPDQYAPAEGLLYFPRTMEIPTGDSRVIRVGVRAAPVTREEAYRLFIEELPPAAVADDQAQGTSLRVFLRVGVAVFVAPAQSVRKGEITSLDLNGRHVEWVVANTGNVHFRADQVELVGLARDGTRLFVQPFQERYFLAGVSRTLRFDVASQVCAQLATIEAVIVADRLDLKRKIDVPPGSCK